MNKNNTLLIIAGIAAIYFLTQQRRVQQYPPAPMTYRGSPEWVYWANTIINSAGGLTQQLFGPGGPFYRQNPQEVAQLANYSGYVPYGV
jgi:uncharacterized membrane protein YfcA